MITVTKKIKKSFTLDDSVYKLIENYATLNGVSASSAVNSLILNGLTNLNTATELQEQQRANQITIKKEMKKQYEEMKNIMIENIKLSSKIYGYTAFPDKVVSHNSNEEKRDFESAFVNATYKRLKNYKNKNLEEVFYEEI